MESPSGLCSSLLNVLVLSSCTGLFVYCQCKIPHASIVLACLASKVVLLVKKWLPATLLIASFYSSSPYIHLIACYMSA